MRVGIGFDAHVLATGCRLVLGGVVVPFHKGLVGHSDGDVLVHAILDAVLGAGGLKDKGYYFPSQDPQLSEISSLELLKRVKPLLIHAGWIVQNIDATIVAQSPPLASLTGNMVEGIADSLAIDKFRVNVKITTSDGLGFTGRSEGIAAWAVALLERDR